METNHNPERQPQKPNPEAVTRQMLSFFLSKFHNQDPEELIQEKQNPIKPNKETEAEKEKENPVGLKL